MIEAIALDLIAPPALVQEVRKRGRRSKRPSYSTGPVQRQRRGTNPRRLNTAVFIGAIVILTDSDGTDYQCEIIDRAPDGAWECLRLD